MNIILLRHGEAIDDKLTDRGIRQAKMAAEIVDTNISKIYCSPTFRTQETAAIIAEKLNLDVIIDPRLNERVHHPDNLNDLELEEFNKNYLNRNNSYESTEGCKQFLARVFNFLDDIISNNPTAEKILVVTHSSLSYAFFEYFSSSAANHLIWCRLSNCSMLSFESKDKEN